MRSVRVWEDELVPALLTSVVCSNSFTSDSNNNNRLHFHLQEEQRHFLLKKFYSEFESEPRLQTSGSLKQNQTFTQSFHCFYYQLFPSEPAQIRATGNSSYKNMTWNSAKGFRIDSTCFYLFVYFFYWLKDSTFYTPEIQNIKLSFHNCDQIKGQKSRNKLNERVMGHRLKAKTQNQDLNTK